nr:hypothetical protein [Tanacetum cinerariifolium]
MINAQVDDLSSRNTKYTSPALTQKVFANIRRIGKGFSRVDTPLFARMLVQQQVKAVKDAAEDKKDDNEVSAEPTQPSPTPTTPPPPPPQESIPSSPQAESAQPSSPFQQQPSHTTNISMTLLNTLLENYATLTKQDANLEQDKVAQAIEITKIKQRVRRVKSLADIVMDDQEDASKQGGIAELDANEDVTLEDVDAKVEVDADDTDKAEPAEVEEVIEVVTAAKLMTEVVTTAATIITTAQVPKASAPRRRRGVVIQDPKETSTTLVIMHSEVKSKDKGKGILTEEPKPLKRQAQFKQDEAFARQLEAKLNANINWDDVMEQETTTEKKDNTVMRYQALKRKHVTEAQARKNMMIYLKNMVGFKMDFFKDDYASGKEIPFDKIHSRTNVEQSAGGNLLNRTPRDALTIIENKSKVRISRNKPVVSKVSTTTSSPSPSLDVTALTEKKLSLHDLTLTRMTLGLATRSIAYPAGIVEDVFVQLGKITYPADFIVLDYKVDPRVPLILGRPFLRTASALVDHGNESINMINFIDITCEDRFIKVLKIRKSNHPSSGSACPPSNSSSSLTPFETSDSLLEEFANELALLDPFPPENEDENFDLEAGLRKIKYLLNQDPSTESEINIINPVLERFTNEPALDYSPPSGDDDDELFGFKSDNDEWKKLLYENCYKDIDSKKIKKDSKMKFLVIEAHIVESNDLLPRLLNNDSTLPKSHLSHLRLILCLHLSSEKRTM